MNNLRDQSTIFGLSFGGLTATCFRDQTSKYFKNTALQSPVFNPV
jgi:enterochelin esterase-like enzyme